MIGMKQLNLHQLDIMIRLMSSLFMVRFYCYLIRACLLVCVNVEYRAVLFSRDLRSAPIDSFCSSLEGNLGKTGKMQRRLTTGSQKVKTTKLLEFLNIRLPIMRGGIA